MHTPSMVQKLLLNHLRNNPIGSEFLDMVDAACSSGEMLMLLLCEKWPCSAVFS